MGARFLCPRIKIRGGTKDGSGKIKTVAGSWLGIGVGARRPGGCPTGAGGGGGGERPQTH